MEIIYKKTSIVFLLLFISSFAKSQNRDSSFLDITRLLDQKSFIQAIETYKEKHAQLSPVYHYYIEACIANAFNQLQKSEESIGKLLDLKKPLPDSLMIKVYETRKDNAIKLYHYKEAAEVTGLLLQQYASSLSPEKVSDLQNDFRLWSALSYTPPQNAVIKDNTVLKVRQDKAGLKNIKVSCSNDTLDFVFDTGANISTVSASTAKKMGMKIVADGIKVGAITGKEVDANIAVCDKLLIGNIEVRNAVFLVFEDADLSFPQIDYHINGILGFPVIEAMKEIQLTKDGFFKVPKTPAGPSISSNLALNGLIPVVFIDGLPYTLDTGAGQTLLYPAYFAKHQSEIIHNYQPTGISFGGAGGGRKVNGYNIKANFNLAGKSVTLKNVDVITDDLNEEQGIFGNIGQDVIGQFNAMTLNFEKMFLRFE